MRIWLTVLVSSVAFAGCIEGPPPLPADAPDDDVVAAPEGVGSIGGHFCNARTGATVLGGEVTIALSTGERTVTTDASTGRFVIDDVPDSHHRLVVVSDDDVRQTVEVDVVAGVQTLLDPGECETFDPSTTGFIVGTVCRPDGVPAGGARVFVNSLATNNDTTIGGAIYEVAADDDGAFLLGGVAAPSIVNLRAERGFFVFTWSDVQVLPTAAQPDGTSLTPDGPDGCTALVPDDSRRTLVVDGLFGDVVAELDRAALINVDVLSGVPENPADDWLTAAFGNFEALSVYDAVVIESGVDESDFALGISPAIRENVRRYVEGGGTLYVSAWSYDLIEAVFPARVDFFGDDEENSDAEHAAEGSYVARVIDAELASALGDTIEVELPRASVLIDGVADDVTVYVDAVVDIASDEGTMTTPLAFGFEVGAGRVLFNAVDCGQAGCAADGALTQALLFSL